MKKILAFIIFVLTAASIYYIYDEYVAKKEKEEILLPISGEAIIDNYYVYSTHFNMSGYLDNVTDIKEIKLITYNNVENNIDFNYELNEDKIVFNIADKINNGYIIDNLNVGNNYLLLKLIFSDDTFKYYNLKNNTNKDELTYYTLSNKGNKIEISSDNSYNTLMFKVEKDDFKNIYDITIDPGHGGNDPGACSKGNCEENIVLEISKMLRDELIKKGYKVNLTRESDENIPSYNENEKIGRAVIPQESNSKYVFSIHLNSHVNKKMHGVEILTPNNIDYTFASSLANNIVSEAGTNYSINKGYKIQDGVYTRVFTSSDIQSHINEYGNNAYNVSEGASYYYMIRETGGILTGAYVDDRNIEKGENPYYNSNKGIETYILELGYIINSTDIDNIINNKDKYVRGIVKSISENIMVSE